MAELEELLSKLASASESPALTYEGKAVSRDGDNLHLAISSGVIAIPLADISDVRALSEQETDIVGVTVTRADRIMQIRFASPMLRNIGGSGVGGFGGFASSTYSNGHYIDSATASGGRADSTDDAWWAEEADDVWA